MNDNIVFNMKQKRELTELQKLKMINKIYLNTLLNIVRLSREIPIHNEAIEAVKAGRKIC